MTILKSFFAVTFLILLLCTPVDAKMVTDKLPLLTFAETDIATYDSPNGTKKGTIPPASSLVLVKQILADGWAYGSYLPSSSTNSKKRVYRWFKMTELQGYEDFTNDTDQLTNDSYVYRTRTSTQYIGNAPSNEDVIIVAKRGDRTKIIFKADGNYYRMGWIENYKLKKTAGSGTSSGDTGNGTLTDGNESTGVIQINNDYPDDK